MEERRSGFREREREKENSRQEMVCRIFIVTISSGVNVAEHFFCPLEFWRRWSSFKVFQNISRFHPKVKGSEMDTKKISGYLAVSKHSPRSHRSIIRL